MQLGGAVGQVPFAVGGEVAAIEADLEVAQFDNAVTKAAVNGELVHRRGPPGEMPSIEQKSSRAPRPGRAVEVSNSSSTSMGCSSVPMSSIACRIVRHVSCREVASVAACASGWGLAVGESVVVNRAANGDGQVTKPRLRVLDLDVLSGEGDIGVYFVEVGRLLRADRVTDVGVRDARAVDQAGAAPPVQPGEADPHLVDLQHDVLPVGIAKNGDAIGQHRAGGIEQEPVDRDRKWEDMTPLDFRQQVGLGHVGQAEETEPRDDHQKRHGNRDHRSKRQPRQQAFQVMAIRFHSNAAGQLSLDAKDAGEHQDL